jgi:ribose-phosphate pyrophosphokinase
MTKGKIILNESPELYTQFSYPGGETQVRLNERGLKFVAGCDELTVVARIYNAQDIINLALLKSAIDGVIYGSSTRKVILFLPYLPYGRADRRFVNGDCFGLEAFMCLVESMRFDEVRTLDAHSPTARKWVVDISPMPLIEKVVADVAAKYHSSCVTVLFPDEGALRRYELPDRIGNNHVCVEVNKLFCAKQRDPETGKLLGFYVPSQPGFYQGPVLVVDDICDGGGTFIGIGGAVRAVGVNNPLNLYVTFGIFSKGLEALYEYFSHIYTTDAFWIGRKCDEKFTVFPAPSVDTHPTQL